MSDANDRCRIGLPSRLLGLGACLVAVASTGAIAQTRSEVDSIPGFHALSEALRSRFETFDVILEPDADEPEWWAGAPSVVVDDHGTFWMAARMRTADSPRGLRGYEIRLLRSDDGIRFTPVHRLRRDEVPMAGFERPALLIDPETKAFKLYLCGPWKDGPWSIVRLADASSPDRFDPSTARPVLVPGEPKFDRDLVISAYKDPFILYAEGTYHMYVTGYLRRNERIFHFTSKDGEAWSAVGPPEQSILDLAGWHDFFIRPASVVPIGIGYLFFYEGSSATWHDPVYNVVTGVGITFDLHHILDLTPEAPLALSSTPSAFHTWRYSHWLLLDGELRAYAEVADSNGTNEVRLFRFPLD